MDTADRRTQIRASLTSMCYSEQRPGVWMKPAGWQLFVFIESTSTWMNNFVDATGKLSVWNSCALAHDADVLSFLKDTESLTRIDMRPHDSSFELASFDSAL